MTPLNIRGRRPRFVSFETRIEWAHCLNCRVEVQGNSEEGVTAVRAVGIGHVGEDITESLGERTLEGLHEELMAWIAEEEGDIADRIYDEQRDHRMLARQDEGVP